MGLKMHLSYATFLGNATESFDNSTITLSNRAATAIIPADENKESIMTQNLAATLDRYYVIDNDRSIDSMRVRPEYEVFYIGEEECPRCSGHDPAELFAGEVWRIRNHLAEKQRKLWIWGDRLLDGKTG